MANDDGIDLVSGFHGVSLKVGFCSDVALGSRLMYFNNFKSRAHNTTRIHNSGLIKDLGTPVCVPKWFIALGNHLGIPVVAPKF